MNYLQALFKANGYPKSFIRNCLKEPHFERSSGEKPKFWLSIPYVKNVSEATARILKPFGIGVAHKPECTIRQQIMKPKDPLPTTEQSAVVYSIPCLNCNARYVGETGKRLGTRLHEHQLAISRKDKLSLVYGHIRELNHDFAFEKARVIDRANEEMARLVLEIWSSSGTLNRAIDLHPAYQALRTRLGSARTGPVRPPRSGIQPDEIMVFFDVTSLFTSIPPNLAREVLRKRLEETYDETRNALKIEHLMRLFEFCQQTFFTFAGETYEQIKGTPMGSPVSGLVAELVLQELEKIAFLQPEPVFCRRYVDDTFVIIKGMLQHFHSLLNAVFPDIKFTREEEQKQHLPFLDVLIRRNLKGELETTVYRKATNTTQLLCFHSSHPMAHKRRCVKKLFKGIQTHCSKPEDRAREAR
ncbi:hypothetical protein SprV_0902765100 [Sparganum proliferum]